MATTTQKKVTMSKFLTTALKDVNKSESDRIKESVESFVAEAKIDAEQQVGAYEADLKKLQLDLKKKQNDLKKAEEGFETARFSTATNFESYLNNRNSAQAKVFAAMQAVSSVNNEIAGTELTIKEFKSILSDFE